MNKLEQVVSNVTDSPKYDELVRQVESLSGDLQRTARLVESLAKEQKNALGEFARDRAERTLDQAERLSRSATESVAHTRERTEAAIREQPFTSLAVAAGVGFLVGLLGTRGR